jgi:hypothetical protein
MLANDKKVHTHQLEKRLKPKTLLRLPAVV